MSAYYNEIDPYAAQWLRNLITAGHIAPGEVDERSIEDILPSELDGYTQCHFFAGIGVWSLALRRAGWPDDRPVWTGSCPCQPFSAAGQGLGFADERHLWPAWHHLLRERKPPTVFGEQVASRDGYAWLDLVQTDVEAAGYAFGPVVLPAAGFGAPHGRHRIFFVADTNDQGLEKRRKQPAREELSTIERSGASSGVDDPKRERFNARRVGDYPEHDGVVVGSNGETGGLGVSDRTRREPGESPAEATRHGDTAIAASADVGTVEYPESEQERVSRLARERRATGGHWADADWLPCQGGKWRPIEPGTFPLAHGITCRMDKLRAFGNAISPQVAAEVIRAFLEG